jgi:hypothetical protein
VLKILYHYDKRFIVAENVIKAFDGAFEITNAIVDDYDIL